MAPKWWFRFVVFLTLLALIAFVAKKFFAGSLSSENARDYQVTPEATVSKMFELLKNQGDTLSAGNFLADKNLTPEEQKFAELFWNTQRCAILYRALYDREAALQSLSTQDSTADSATVNAQVKALATANDTEKSDRLYTFDLRKRGPNWRIYELRSEALPMGVFRKFEELQGKTP
jgi:hypothetical protein